ncbi:hypothetical protein GE061_011016 [Apolygus lucorum]|uniref:VDE lipocalin domain-containing protein n=1 Tax=Apolygus lucorum TaxID=248454 RepID=A0A6A4K624_APOLU|nr:hypothetical protein GE061_011016 [Apolygus lucorum]
MCSFRTIIVLCAISSGVSGYRNKEDKTMCPQVKGARNFNLESLLGSWYVVQYYATSEEDVIYKCMRAVFEMGADDGANPAVDLNITYSFVDDPDNEMLMGNITYVVPDMSKPAHWVHSEDTFLEMYNTYILDCDNNEWALLLNCAEKPKSPRYLTSLMISKTPNLAPGVVSFLRDKLPKYDITLDYMFEMKQENCEDPSKNLHYASASQPAKTKKGKHPLKRKNRSKNSVKRH